MLTSGLLRYGKAVCGVVLLSVSAVVVQATPREFTVSLCDDIPACGQDGADTSSPTVDILAAFDADFPDLDVVVAEVSAPILQLGSGPASLAATVQTGNFQETFDFETQRAFQKDPMARLEIAVQSEDYPTHWVQSVSVSEPATFALMVLGLVGVYLISRGGKSKS
jgi:hypothetical protein